jgi:hypothetical protein
MQDEKSRVARQKLRNLLSDEKNLTWKSVNRTPLWDKRKKSPCEGDKILKSMLAAEINTGNRREDREKESQSVNHGELDARHPNLRDGRNQRRPAVGRGSCATETEHEAIKKRPSGLPTVENE